MRASVNVWCQAASRVAIALALLLVTAVSASAETLLMPKRDAKKDVPVVVWGVSTLPNGTAYSIDFGDTTTASGTVGDRSYIHFSHTYTAAGNYTATLTVGAESASVQIQVFDPALLTAENNRSLGINLAIEDGLRYLWTSQANRAAGFPDDATTYWSNSFSYADTSLIVLAFQNHGYKLTNNNVAPTGLYEKYIVRRGLNYVLQSLSTLQLDVQPAGNPCVGSGAGWNGADCVGLSTTTNDNHSGYGTSVAILPFASSGALTRLNSEVGGATAGMTFGEVLQRLVNTAAWGQTDSGAGRGGWGYSHNGYQFDGSTVGWAILGFLDAEAAGAVVPAFVRTEFKFGFDNALNDDGSFDYSEDGSPSYYSSPGPQKAGIGLQGLFFIGEAAGARHDLVKANISSWWESQKTVTQECYFYSWYGWYCYDVETYAPLGIGQNSWGGPPNKGSAYSMFNNFKGLKLSGISTLPGVARAAGPGGSPAGDWYADYQDWLVANQQSANSSGGGDWGTINFSCCYSGAPINTAIAELILSPVALVLPDADKFGAVGLTPPTNTALELTTHTVTAHAESTGGTPVPGATVNFVIISGPNAGLTGTGTTDSTGEATFTYTDQGPEGSVGIDRIQATIGNLESNIVVMTWTPLNAPPVAVADAASTFSGTPVTVAVLGNDSDPDDDALTVTGTSAGPANGAVAVNGDGTITYTPNLGFAGIDSFTYAIADGKGGTSTATVTITVTKRSLTVTANSYTRSYLSPDPAFDGTLTGVAAGDTITATYSSTGAGSQTPGVYPTVPTLSDPGGKLANYTVTSVNGTLTITNTVPACVIAPSITSIWPPNHKMVSVTASGATDVDGGPLTYSVVSIFQDEPTNTTGDGNTAIDGAGIGTSTAQVRAERTGDPKNPGDGRVYHITFSVTDSLGLSCQSTVQVGVPHDQSGKVQPVDGGALFNSTVAGAPPAATTTAKGKGK